METKEVTNIIEDIVRLNALAKEREALKKEHGLFKNDKKNKVGGFYDSKD